MKTFRKWLDRRSFLGFLGFVVLLGSWLSTPALVSAAAKNGLRLCAQVMIPSLFPFFVLSNLFVQRGYHQYITCLLRPVMGPLFGLDAQCAGAATLGAVGGYPIGAATVFNLYDQDEISASQASRAMMFCNNAGPAYIFGVVGMSILDDLKMGALVYLVHLFSAVLVGIGANLWFGRCCNLAEPVTKSPYEPEDSFPVSFVEAIRNAAATMLNVCAFLVFFAVMLSFLRTSPIWGFPAQLFEAIFRIEPQVANALLDGMMELSTGISSLSTDIASRNALMAVSSFLLGWGGLCVHCQVLSLCGRRAIPMGPYFLGKLLQGILSSVIIVGLLRAPLIALLICALTFTVAILILHFRKKPLEKAVSMEYNGIKSTRSHGT